MNGNIIIKHASELVTCSGFTAKRGSEMSDLHIIEDGGLVIENGIITAVGREANEFKDVDETRWTIIDATGKSVLPGFVDPHTHFVFGGYRAEEFGWRVAGESYINILERGGGIHNSVKATRDASKELLIQTGLKRLDSMLSFGVTTVEGKSGYGLDRDTEIKQLEVMAYLDSKHPIDVVKTFLGAHVVPKEYQGKADEYIDFLVDTVLPEVVEKNLAEFCDVFCEKTIYSVPQSRKLLSKAKSLGLKLKFHADELETSGGAELSAELNATSADHLIKASDKGLQAMAEKDVAAVLLPATAFSLREPYARARYMIDENLTVALATDMNPGSCFTESIPLVFALSVLNMGMTIEESVSALTINSAAALDRVRDIGSLDVGKKGDVIILEFPSYQFIPYHMGVSAVEKTIKAGTVVYDKEKNNDKVD